MVQRILIYLAVLVLVIVIAAVAESALSNSGSGSSTHSGGTTSVASLNISVATSVSNLPGTTETTTSTTTTPQQNFTLGGMGSWQATSSYPSFIYNQTCVAWNGYVYCIGGLISAGSATNHAYYARISSSGIGAWKATTPYFVNISAPSCSVYGSTVYCASGTVLESGGVGEGGGASNGSSQNAIAQYAYGYYANLSASGIGPWTLTPAAPLNLAGTSCTISNGALYCVGGMNSNGKTFSAVKYASVKNGAYKFWLPGANYPVNTSFTACVGGASIVYCMAGTGSQGAYYGIINYSYGAIGGWFPSGTYPAQAYAPSCAAYNASVYCIGGFTSQGSPINGSYYARLSQSGIVAWSQGQQYPAPGLDDGSCVASNGYLYCIGGQGQNGASYFARI